MSCHLYFAKSGGWGFEAKCRHKFWSLLFLLTSILLPYPLTSSGCDSRYEKFPRHFCRYDVMAVICVAVRKALRLDRYISHLLDR